MGIHVEESDEAFDRQLATRLRFGYDFPADSVAAELVADYRRDVPRDLVKHWSSALSCVDVPALLHRVSAPVLIYDDAEHARASETLAKCLQGSRVAFGRAHAYNAVRARALRAAFDDFLGRLAPASPDVPAHNGSGLGLSGREREVLAMMAAGRSNAEIAPALVITHATVSTHVRHILEKTGSANRAAAAALAVRLRLA
jgi:DNA-binding CsgD family transcriptional regulator